MAGYPEAGFDYAKGLEIDQYNLEHELIAIPKQIWEISKVYVQATFDRNKAKESLEITQAQLDASIRMAASNRMDAKGNPDPEKITEAVVKNRIVSSPTFIEAQERVFKADYAVEIMKAGVSAYYAKKSVLDNLVKLQTIKYYSEPYEVPSNISAIGLEQGRRMATESLRGTMTNSPEAIREGRTPPPRLPARPPMKK